MGDAMTTGRRLRMLATGVVVSTLAACVAVPLSTIWKMHDMTAERFLANDPKQLRVAIRVDDAMQRGSASPQIRIDIAAPSTKPICYAFPLDAIDPRASGELSLEAPPAHRRWYAFALSPRGIEAFERARREVRTRDVEEADLAFNVTMTNVLVISETATSLPMRIDVALDRKDGYFTMVKETDIPFTRAGKGADGPPKPTSSSADVKAKPVCIPAA